MAFSLMMHWQLSGKAAAGCLHIRTVAESLSMTVTLQLASIGGEGGGVLGKSLGMSLLLFV